MRRILVAIFRAVLIVAAIFSEAKAATDDIVVDQTGTLGEEELRVLAGELGRLERATHVHARILIFSGHHAASLGDFANIQLALIPVREDAERRAVLLYDLNTSKAWFTLDAGRLGDLSPGVAWWVSERMVQDAVHRESIAHDLSTVIRLVEELLMSNEKFAPLTVPQPRSSIVYFLLGSLGIGLITAFSVGAFLRGVVGTLPAAIGSSYLAYLVASPYLPMLFAGVSAGMSALFVLLLHLNDRGVLRPSFFSARVKSE